METPSVEYLVRDLLEWIARRERTYEEAIDAWRTSCPRLPVWEEASDRGFLSRREVHGRCVVSLTPAGAAFLKQPAGGPGPYCNLEQEAE